MNLPSYNRAKTNQGEQIVLKWILAAASLFLLVGCGGDDSPPPAVDGTWAAPTVVVGASTTMSLVSQQSSVTGTGAYTIEAGPSGTFTVSGMYKPPELSLVLHYDNGRVASYSATLTDASHMNGTIASSGQAPSPLEFVKE